MPWKEPGEKPSEPSGRPPPDREPRGQGPWGGQGGGSGPDLEAWLRNGRRKLGPFGRGPLGALALVVVAVLLWFLIGGWTVIGGQQVGVLLRFGRLQAVLQPGFHLRLPSPIDRLQKLDIGEPLTASDQTRLLTGDGQLALVDYYAQYKITNVRDFLFANRDGEDAIRNAAAVAVRAAVGTHSLQQLLDHDGDDLTAAITRRLQAVTDAEGLGVEIVEAGIQSVGVPNDVKPAFDDIAKAHEDAKSALATATADVARDKLRAQARAAAIKADAATYRDGAAAAAQADVAHFQQVLTQYQAAPQVTRHRLWLDAMQDVLSHNHVVINSGSGNVIVQFPARASTVALPVTAAPASAATAAPPVTSGPALQGDGT
ncbi:MAG TPA: FtsH protease activity modulator HflK [Rhodanobacteraceae bacterium]|nr:FtsH protease activity modulator HflK [Rhodanobacteraceae bacterium]